ncbi:hypothetical protein HDA32_001699 [Spinactinospora alkalitolerans]|uniref:Secreted protein n=1 Tax=Spinactinospora alkalitolerans TaxID=687207 RepID=A0A852TRF0_9ACTN|nr:hypothetical protein [Spinactinospora alkalitolerans]NYE46579.1 hypothetical protein [Spinactinospora alkalitolerans]
MKRIIAAAIAGAAGCTLLLGVAAPAAAQEENSESRRNEWGLHTPLGTLGFSQGSSIEENHESHEISIEEQETENEEEAQE